MIEETDKKILLDGIDAAEGFGQCWYSKTDGEPSCVVGQIAVSVGVSKEQLNAWCPGSWSNVKESGEKYRQEYAPGSDLVIAFEQRTGANLQHLQSIWDRKSVHRTEEAARNAMRQYVEGL